LKHTKREWHHGPHQEQGDAINDRKASICHERQEVVNRSFTDNLAAGRVADTRLLLKAVRQRWQKE
jgi:hypothetical protein